MDRKIICSGYRKAPGIGLAASPGARAHVTTREDKGHYQYIIGAPDRKGRVLNMTIDELKKHILDLLGKVPAGKLERLYWFLEALVVGRF